MLYNLLTLAYWTMAYVCTTVSDAYLAVLGNFDLQELKLEFLINWITISLQIESLGEVELSSECASCSVASTRWDAEGGPLIDRIERDCDSVWKILIGNWSPTTSSVPYVCVSYSTFHSQIVACFIRVVSGIWYPQTITNSSITNSGEKVWIRCGRVLKVYSDCHNDVISREFTSVEQRDLHQTRTALVDLKVQWLRRGCNEVAETGMVLQPLRGHHFVVQRRVWGRAAVHLWREGVSWIELYVCMIWMRK